MKKRVIFYLFLIAIVSGCVLFAFDVSAALSAGHYGKYGSVCAILCISYVLLLLWRAYDELTTFRSREKGNYVFGFTRKVSSALSLYAKDEYLAKLALDYGLSDSDIERIARDGVRDAALKYRKEHPLEHPLSYDIEDGKISFYEE